MNTSLQNNQEMNLEHALKVLDAHSRWLQTPAKTRDDLIPVAPPAMEVGLAIETVRNYLSNTSQTTGVRQLFSAAAEYIEVLEQKAASHDAESGVEQFFECPLPNRVEEKQQAWLAVKATAYSDIS